MSPIPSLFLPLDAHFLLANPWKSRVVLDQGPPKVLFQRRYEGGNAVIRTGQGGWDYWFEIGTEQPIEGAAGDGAAAWSALRDAVGIYQANRAA